MPASGHGRRPSATSASALSHALRFFRQEAWYSAFCSRCVVKLIVSRIVAPCSCGWTDSVKE